VLFVFGQFDFAFDFSIAGFLLRSDFPVHAWVFSTASLS
jgi:hypothetical protein